MNLGSNYEFPITVGQLDAKLGYLASFGGYGVKCCVCQTVSSTVSLYPYHVAALRRPFCGLVCAEKARDLADKIEQLQLLMGIPL